MSVNGAQVGAHRGGYDPFTFDITDALASGRRSGDRRRASGIRPTRVRSRAASRCSIREASGTPPSPASGRQCGSRTCRLLTSLAFGSIRTSMQAFCECGWRHSATPRRAQPRRSTPSMALASSVPRTGRAGETIAVSRPERETLVAGFAIPLRPKVRLSTGDEVKSYFGMRKISVGPDAHGVNRLMLNGSRVVSVWPARSGLVAGRPVYGAHGGGAALRRRDPEAYGLQYDPQARQGRAGAVVLRLRSTGHARLAGHAERREQHAGRHRQLRPRARRGDWRPAESSIDRHVGAVQRRVGAARDRRSTWRTSRRSIPRGW